MWTEVGGNNPKVKTVTMLEWEIRAFYFINFTLVLDCHKELPLLALDRKQLKSLLYLFQRSVRNSKTAQPQVCQGLLQLSEEAGICSLLKILIWKKEDNFLTDAFHQLCLWNVVANHIHQLIHIP